MQIFDKIKIKANFNRANQTYNQAAILQKTVAKHLVNLAKQKISTANKILDLGSGTGFIAEEILSEFSDKKIFQLDIAQQLLQTNPFKTSKIAADIEALPFKRNVFDLALSSLSFQWLNHLDKAIPQILKTLKNKGNFYFSIIVDGSLDELKIARQKCAVQLTINDFTSITELEKILLQLQLNYQIKSETIILQYDNLPALLKSIKSIGAGYGSTKKSITKNDLQKISSFYLKNFNLDNKVHATWKICYVLINL